MSNFIFENNIMSSTSPSPTSSVERVIFDASPSLEPAAAETTASNSNHEPVSTEMTGASSSHDVAHDYAATVELVIQSELSIPASITVTNSAATTLMPKKKSVRFNMDDESKKSLSRCPSSCPSSCANSCPICFEEFDVFDCQALECSHVFHADCLTSWVTKSRAKTCPMCRRVSPYLEAVLISVYGQASEELFDQFGRIREGARINRQINRQMQRSRRIYFDFEDDDPNSMSLPFWGRCVLAIIYVSLLYYHQKNPTIGLLVNNQFCRTLIALCLMVYVMAGKFGLAMQHLPRVLEAVIPFSMSMYVFWIVISPYIQFLFHGIGYFVCLSFLVMLTAMGLSKLRNLNFSIQMPAIESH